MAIYGVCVIVTLVFYCTRIINSCKKCSSSYLLYLQHLSDIQFLIIFVRKIGHQTGKKNNFHYIIIKQQFTSSSLY